MDFIEFDTILVIVDQLTKQAIFIPAHDTITSTCYDSMLTVLSKELTLVLSDTRELDRVTSTKYSTLYTNPHGPC